MKILDRIWFTQMGNPKPIGIIVTQDKITGEKKAWIGLGYGQVQSRDEKYIAQTGASLTKATLTELTKWLED